MRLELKVLRALWAAALAFALVAVAVTVVGMLTGCGEQYGSHYAVGIDPSFTHEQREVIELALSDWVNAVGGALLPFDVSEQRCYGEGDDAIICVHASDYATVNRLANEGGYYGSFLGFTKRCGWRDSADVYIPLDTDLAKDDRRLFKDVAHEVGHAMGLHHTGLGTLMYPNINVQADSVTCEDARQYDALRGWYPDSPCP